MQKYNYVDNTGRSVSLGGAALPPGLCVSGAMLSDWRNEPVGGLGASAVVRVPGGSVHFRVCCAGRGAGPCACGHSKPPPAFTALSPLPLGRFAAQVLQCGHQMHRHCVLEMLASSWRCPICR